MKDAKALFNQFFGRSKGSAEPQTGGPQKAGSFSLQSLVSGRGGLASGALAGSSGPY